MINYILKKVFFFISPSTFSLINFELKSFWGRVIAFDLKVDSTTQNYINLGSGSINLPGFINIDFFTCSAADYKADLRFPLRIPDESIDGIFCEHTLEHLDYRQGENLLRECYRILKSGGIIRLIVPDVGLFVKHYNDPSSGWFHQWEKLMFEESIDPDRSDRKLLTRMQAISFVTQEYGHISAWDEETSEVVLRKAGLGGVKFFSFRHGQCERLLADLDSADRKHVSLYVEARK
jgi:SAM-dependent methyltransferase